jgi:hypothetical protein
MLVIDGKLHFDVFEFWHIGHSFKPHLPTRPWSKHMMLVANFWHAQTSFGGFKYYET